MGGKDYNGNGFQQGDDGVFGDPGAGGGSASDYDTWDWKQIMAAINGMAAGTNSDSNHSHAESVSDPRTLQAAANAFYQVQLTLTGVAKALSDQAKALAGEEGPWKGGAADAFHDMMQTFSKQVQANAEVLGGGSGGGHSVPQQLADNSVNLLNAQNKIVDIDNWYAHQAVLAGVRPMSNGLIPVSQKPEIVTMMNESMRGVLKSLAGEYQVTIDSVHSPSGVPSPLAGPGPQPNPNTDGGPHVPLPDEAPPLPDASSLPELHASNLNALPFPGATSLGGPEAFPSGALGGSGALPQPGSPPLAGDTIAPFGDFAGLPNGGGLDGLGGSETFDPAALDSLLNPGLNPQRFSGSTDAGGAGTLNPGVFAPSPFQGGTRTSGSGGTSNFGGPASPGRFPSDSPLEGFPGSTGVGGDGAPAFGDGLEGVSPSDASTEAAPLSALGGQGMESPVLETAGPADLLAPYAGGTGTQGSGVPMMPGLGGVGGGAGRASGEGERSDASALLEPSVLPWAGDSSVGAGVGSEFGAVPGGEGLRGWEVSGFPVAGESGGEGVAEGSGVPMMPGLGGVGGGAGRGPGEEERSDASALLEPTDELWLDDEERVDEVGSATGAPAGAAPLSETAAAQARAHAESAGVPPLPYGRSGESSRAAGDADGSSASWMLLASDRETRTDDGDALDEPFALSPHSGTDVGASEGAGAEVSGDVSGLAAAGPAAPSAGVRAVAEAVGAATGLGSPAGAGEPAAPVAPAAFAQSMSVTTGQMDPVESFVGDDAEWTRELAPLALQGAGGSRSAASASTGARPGAEAGGGAEAALPGVGPGQGIPDGARSFGGAAGEGTAPGSPRAAAAAGYGHEGRAEGRASEGRHDSSRDDGRKPGAAVMAGVPIGVPRPRKTMAEEEEVDGGAGGRGHGVQRGGSHRRPDSDLSDAADTFDTELDGGLGALHDEVLDDPGHRVAVVGPVEEDDEDTGAWHSEGSWTGSGVRSLVAPGERGLGVGAEEAARRAASESAPEAAAIASPEEPPPMMTWKPRRPAAAGAGAHDRPIDTTSYQSSAADRDATADVEDSEVVTASGTGPGANDEESAGPRRSVDLLVQDESNWGLPPAESGAIGG
ncbi:WXG100 family type VII secretion target [Streptomyces fuscigenes]|uniref:WXG100 family type VII secretion target n=1 Tax=Streptomyces fuscigenes TaxID=1528880 RepID=UPI001F39EF50|nr:WXG100 family type VII secretion target [Streptomyces fuscigenes]MCF3961230.1 WXG100 family type VII secretion target [Streptomyces fuscigenes]